MPYVTTNPPVLVATGLAANGQVWSYKSTDAATVVDGDGYITNAKALGMRVSDLVFVTDTDASPVLTTMHTVVAINANGSANLSNSDGSNSD